MKGVIVILFFVALATADDEITATVSFHAQGIIPFINNGTVSEHTPYMASIRLLSEEINQKFGYGHYCAGVFVSRRHVLTVASCLSRNKKISPEELQIIAGSRYRYDDSEANFISVDRIQIHPDYAIKSLPHNVAVIFLSEEISPDVTTIYPISISETPAELNQPFQIFGWGTPLVRNGTRELLTGRVTVVERETCPQAFINRFCAGPWYYGGCQGDDGGALVSNSILYGLVDYRSLEYCEEHKLAHLYVDVVAYRDWIEHTINNGAKRVASIFLVAVAAFSTRIFSS